MIKLLHLSSIVFTLFFNTVFCQVLPVQTITDLHAYMVESSGLLNFNGRIITHNDSGKEAKLFELDTISGAVVRTVTLSNGRNFDWEDLAQDEAYIYIGDIGNNNGTRKNLKIYRVLKQDYLSSTSVSVDSIMFAYAEQVDFTSSAYNTDYDAEAFIATEDSLYLFTKNWKNFKTYIYAFPKTPGTYLPSKKDSLDVQGMITGATYAKSTQEILLTGFSFSNTFLWRCRGFQSSRLSQANNEKLILDVSGLQIEGICKRNGSGYFLSSEAGQNSAASLLHVEVPLIIASLDLPKSVSTFYLYPNPSNDFLYRRGDQTLPVEIYSSNGKLVLSSNEPVLDIRRLRPGLYTIILRSDKSPSQMEQLIIY